MKMYIMLNYLKPCKILVNINMSQMMINKGILYISNFMNTYVI